MKFILCLMMFLIAGALFIISNNSLYVFQDKGANIFCEKYFYWLGNLFSNLKTITGQVVNMKWF